MGGGGETLEELLGKRAHELVAAVDAEVWKLAELLARASTHAVYDVGLGATPRGVIALTAVVRRRGDATWMSHELIHGYVFPCFGLSNREDGAVELEWIVLTIVAEIVLADRTRNTGILRLLNRDDGAVHSERIILLTTATNILLVDCTRNARILGLPDQDNGGVHGDRVIMLSTAIDSVCGSWISNSSEGRARRIKRDQRIDGGLLEPLRQVGKRIRCL
jgi:hypothetical protein